MHPPPPPKRPPQFLVDEFYQQLPSLMGTCIPCVLDYSTVSPTFSPLFRMSYTAKVPSPEAAPQNSMWGIQMSTKKNGVNMSSRGAGWSFWMNVPWFCIKKSCSWLNIDASMIFVSFRPVKVTTKKHLPAMICHHHELLYVCGGLVSWPKNHPPGWLLLKFSPCSLWQQPRKKNLDIQGGKLWVNNIFTIRIYKSCQ